MNYIMGGVALGEQHFNGFKRRTSVFTTINYFHITNWAIEKNYYSCYN